MSSYSKHKSTSTIKNNITLLVLLYNKEINNSKTLFNLFNSKLNLKNLNLIIWNNGPKKLIDKNIDRFISKGINTKIKETISNKSLSKIYNTFIAENRSDIYIILDDDSEINDCYLHDAINIENEALGVPIIYSSDNNIQYPYLNDYIYKNKSYKKITSAMSIGSGLVIGSNIIRLIEAKYDKPFDEKFYFYGVDSSFFHRINRLRLCNKIKIIYGFTHSLSKFDKESDIITSFRLKERTNDTALQLRFYTRQPRSFYYFIRIILIKYLLGMYKDKSFNKLWDLFEFVKTYLTGKHYRIR